MSEPPRCADCAFCLTWTDPATKRERTGCKVSSCGCGEERSAKSRHKSDGREFPKCGPQGLNFVKKGEAA